VYEQVLEMTHAMLDAARKGDWDRLVQSERDRDRLVEEIKRQDPDPARDVATRARKREIIVQILQGDEQIQMLTQDWMHELREVLGSIQTEQRLSRTYGP
jgi:flagellar protein FliT